MQAPARGMSAPPPSGWTVATMWVGLCGKETEPGVWQGEGEVRVVSVTAPERCSCGRAWTVAPRPLGVVATPVPLPVWSRLGQFTEFCTSYKSAHCYFDREDWKAPKKHTCRTSGTRSKIARLIAILEERRGEWIPVHELLQFTGAVSAGALAGLIMRASEEGLCGRVAHRSVYAGGDTGEAYLLP